MFSFNPLKFEIPKMNTRFREAKFGNVIDEKSIENSILLHHFNTKLIFHMPDTLSLPSTIMSYLSEESTFYCINNLSLKELCDVKFIKAFVDCGQVYGFSINTRLDIDDCAAFIPSGSLFLLVDSLKYQELGIVGKLSSHILRKPEAKYFIEVDTKANGFLPGKNLYERTHKAFTSCPMQFNFYITWVPNDNTVCPSSIAKYLVDRGYEVEEVSLSLKQNIKSEVLYPLLPPSSDPFPENQFLQWLGFHALDIDQTDSEIVDFKKGSCIDGSLLVAHVEGLFTPLHVLHVIQQLKEWLDVRDSTSVPWVSLTCFGPPDGLVSWAKSEHSFRVNGENLFQLLLRRDSVRLCSVEESRQPHRYFAKASNK